MPWFYIRTTKLSPIWSENGGGGIAKAHPSPYAPSYVAPCRSATP